VEIDVCLADVQLENHIPETLPAYGLRLRIYYHGNKQQCNKCYGLGHCKFECKSKPVTWAQYVQELKSTGSFSDDMFGNWLDGQSLYKRYSPKKKSNGK